VTVYVDNEVFFSVLVTGQISISLFNFFFLLTMVVCKVSHYMCEMRGINRIYRTVVKKINKERSRVECTHLLCTST
jgi:hypothetical protein